MSSHIPIASQTLTSAAATATFNSIPTTLNGKTLRDLVLVCNFALASSDDIRFELNNSSSGYNQVWFNTASTSSTSFASNTSNFDHALATTSAFCIFSIFDFAQTNKHKTILSRFGTAARASSALAGRFASTAAITQVRVRGLSNLSAGSTFSLYGIEG